MPLLFFEDPAQSSISLISLMLAPTYLLTMQQ
jgi:hypothetical protein